MVARLLDLIANITTQHADSSGDQSSIELGMHVLKLWFSEFLVQLLVAGTGKCKCIIIAELTNTTRIKVGRHIPPPPP